jgi:hypothetical protein
MEMYNDQSVVRLYAVNESYVNDTPQTEFSEECCRRTVL